MASFIVTLVLVFIVIVSVCYPYGKKHLIKVIFEGKLVQPDIELAFSRIPSASGRRHNPATDINYNIYTDSLGSRVSLVGEEAPKSTDILVIGGSFSEGHGLENEQTFASLVEKKLNAKTMNFALGSYGTIHSFLILQRVSHLRPKLIIYGMISDHIERNVRPCIPAFVTGICVGTPHFDIDNEGAPYIVPLSDFELEGVRLNIESAELSQSKNFIFTVFFGLKLLWYKNLGQLQYREHSLGDEQKIMIFASVLTNMKKQADKIGAKLLVVYMPLMDMESARPFDKREFLPEGIYFLDATIPLLKKMQATNQNLWVTKKDGHPSAVGHNVIAEEIIKSIKDNAIDYKNHMH